MTADGTETIETTDEHPFWLAGAGWVGASQLTVGERVVLIDGSDATVASTERADYPDGIAVYNWEVESDHTYFVADADTSFTNPVWVHNVCVGDRYLARMRNGRTVEFGGVREQRLVRHPPGANQEIRDAFNNREKARFVKVASGETGARQRLEELHFTPREIDDMVNYGRLPRGFEVHHKLPIEYGGTNDFDNLVIIRKEWHEAIHDEIGREITARAIDVNTEFDINIPMFEGGFIHSFD